MKPNQAKSLILIFVGVILVLANARAEDHAVGEETVSPPPRYEPQWAEADRRGAEISAGFDQRIGASVAKRIYRQRFLHFRSVCIKGTQGHSIASDFGYELCGKKSVKEMPNLNVGYIMKGCRENLDRLCGRG